MDSHFTWKFRFGCWHNLRSERWKNAGDSGALRLHCVFPLQATKSPELLREGDKRRAAIMACGMGCIGVVFMSRKHMLLNSLSFGCLLFHLSGRQPLLYLPHSELVRGLLLLLAYTFLLGIIFFHRIPGAAALCRKWRNNKCQQWTHDIACKLSNTWYHFVSNISWSNLGLMWFHGHFAWMHGTTYSIDWIKTSLCSLLFRRSRFKAFWWQDENGNASQLPSQIYKYLIAQ